MKGERFRALCRHLRRTSEMGIAWSTYLRALDESPLRTKTATSIFITALGNVLSQLVQSQRVKDVNAVKMYATWGLVLAPFNHVWQNTIARHGPASLLGKIVVDHLLWKVARCSSHERACSLFPRSSPHAALSRVFGGRCPSCGLLSLSRRFTKAHR